MNTAPVAVNDFITIDENQTVEFFPQLNDIDEDGDTLTITDVYYSNSNSGYGYIGPNGGIEYNGYYYSGGPEFDYVSYVVSDGNGGEAVGSVQIKINHVNASPTVFVYDESVYENDVGQIYSSFYDDEDSIDQLTITFSGPDGALFKVDENRLYSGYIEFITPPDYENPADANGDNVYEYTVTVNDSDGGSTSASARVTVLDVSELGQTEGDDVLQGTPAADDVDLLGGNDKFFAKAGDDFVYGREGNDTLFGDAGGDYLYGGVGDDKLVGGDGIDDLTGGDGDDILSGQKGDDNISGGDGNDRIYGGDGRDFIFGNDGDDVIFGDDGDDSIQDYGGSNRIYGGKGSDYISISTFDPSVVNTLRGGDGQDALYALEGQARLFGDAGNDVLISGAGNDLLVGGTGDDYFEAGAGNDRLNGEAGTDTLNGGDGDDQMNGGADNDDLYGGSGNDRMIGGDGIDELYGGDGDDTLFGGGGGDSLNGGAGDDRITAGGTGGYIETGEGADTIILEHNDGAWVENDDFDFTQDKLIIRAFNDNAQVIVDSKEELYSLNLNGLTIVDDGVITDLRFSLDDGTKHLFSFNGITEYDIA